uniref:Elongation factor 1-delta n=1 Tax=Cacopsylla melanoneura TaxID=428564 RepID=A0A8D8UGC6_9HEMI
MAKSALLEQYSDIWLDKQDYLEAERIYYEGKLSQILAGNFNSINKEMGRKNKSKQSGSAEAAAPPQTTPPTPVAPLPSDSLPTPPVVAGANETAQKKRNDSECSNKSKGGENKGQGGKGKKGGKQAPPKQPSPPRQNEKAPSPPKVIEEVCPILGTPESTPLSSPDSNSSGGKKGGSGNKADQTGATCETKGSSTNKSNMKQTSLAEEVAKAQEHLKKSLKCMEGIAKFSGGDSPALLNKIATLETENKTFKKDIQSLTDLVKKLELRLSSLEKSGGTVAKPSSAPSAPAANAKPASAPAAEDDDDVDLFGSDGEEESAEAARIREERVAAYNAKKSKKPVLIAKSNIILDVKPWGDDTDMKEMEKLVRTIEMEGLLWGASKLAPLAYGINKLQISCVVEDDLVSVDALTEAIQDIEEYVQSVDIAAFNKV